MRRPTEQTVAELSLDAGQRMEDRLKEYKNAIEGLGFRREKITT